MSSKAAEFVGLYQELVSYFSEQQLPKWAEPNAEVIQRMATSLFIQQNGTHSNGGGGHSHPNPVSTGDPQKVTGILEDKGMKPTNNGGKQFFIVIGGQKYSAFDAKVFGGQIFNKGDKVTAEVVQKGKYWNLLKVEKGSDLDDTGSDIPF